MVLVIPLNSLFVMWACSLRICLSWSEECTARILSSSWKLPHNFASFCQ